jgi:hypothetical protein
MTATPPQGRTAAKDALPYHLGPLTRAAATALPYNLKRERKLAKQREKNRRWYAKDPERARKLLREGMRRWREGSTDARAADARAAIGTSPSGRGNPG